MPSFFRKKVATAAEPKPASKFFFAGKARRNSEKAAAAQSAEGSDTAETNLDELSDIQLRELAREATTTELSPSTPSSSTSVDKRALAREATTTELSPSTPSSSTSVDVRVDVRAASPRRAGSRSCRSRVSRHVDHGGSAGTPAA